MTSAFWHRKRHAMTEAKPGDVDVIGKAKLRVQSVIAALLGAVLYGLVSHVTKPVEAVQVVDKRMELACKIPDAEGAMTVFIVENGNLKCWRWK